MVVLGLDISTSNVGFCIFNDKELLIADAINLSKNKCIFEKADLVKKVLLKIKKFNIDKILIEENLQSFRAGFSSAKTISSLSKFNGIVSYIAQTIFLIKPEFINVIHARSKCGIKIDRKSNLNTKEQVLNWVSSTKPFTNFIWPTKILSSGPRKGQEIKTPQCYDIADAAVLCLYSCN